MSVATLAAFAIGDFAEAVGVMLFYRVGELFEDIAVSRSRSQIMEAVDLRPEVVNLSVETKRRASRPRRQRWGYDPDPSGRPNSTRWRHR